VGVVSLTKSLPRKLIYSFLSSDILSHKTCVLLSVSLEKVGSWYGSGIVPMDDESIFGEITLG
jgi:hypothetical protein